jgi:membrane protease YdiL (CAAX protease family)
MSDSPLTVPIESHTPNIFRSPRLPFVLLRVFIYLVLVEAFTYEFFWIANASGLTGRPALAPRNLFSGEFIRFAAVFAGAWVMARLERRSIGEFGLPLNGALAKHFCQGALFGILEISAVLGTLGALGYYHFGAVELHGSKLIQWLAFWVAFFIVVGLFEEFAFRGYAQFALTQGLGFWLASLATSLIFGAVHLTNPGESWTGIAGVVLTGLFWCFTLRRTGTLWFAVGMHAAFDFGETFLYSVPDSGTLFPGHLSNATLAGPTWLSGGTAGPEASILDFVILIVFFYAFHRLYPPRPASPTNNPPQQLANLPTEPSQ